MFKNRIRMFFNELKLLVFMRSGPRQPSVDAGTSMRGLGAMGGCGWRAFSRCTGDHDHDAEEYYGSDAGARRSAAAAGLDERDARMNADAVSLSSGTRTPQCRICFQGPEQVNTFYFLNPGLHRRYTTILLFYFNTGRKLSIIAVIIIFIIIILIVYQIYFNGTRRIIMIAVAQYTRPCAVY